MQSSTTSHPTTVAYAQLVRGHFHNCSRIAIDLKETGPPAPVQLGLIKR